MINFASNAILCKMEDIDRIKVVLAEKKRTNSWLASELGKTNHCFQVMCKFFTTRLVNSEEGR